MVFPSGAIASGSGSKTSTRRNLQMAPSAPIREKWVSATMPPQLPPGTLSGLFWRRGLSWGVTLFGVRWPESRSTAPTQDYI